MRFILLVLCTLLIAAKNVGGENYPATIVKVVDGDTVHLNVSSWIDETKFVKLRLYGIDTPETSWRAKKPCERVMGLEAKRELSNILKGKILTVEILKYGKYGGRLIGILYVDYVDVSDLMIRTKYATPYFGKKKTKVWC
ncbi:MAG: hypothetical protein BMS9Abin31_0484 [Gammaproteobacteria bacterium]|nr:MAG: hypothetical protein BMS9Abin31_0484 [Gammaproteobacteria bacterium]